MTSKRQVRIHEVYEARLREMGFTWDERHSNAPRHTGLLAEVTAQVNAERDAIEAAMVQRLWTGPLADYPRQILAAQEHNQRVRSAADEAIAALQQQIKDLDRARYEQQIDTDEILKKYEQARQELLRERIGAAQLKVCQRCQNVQSNVTLVLVDQQYVTSHTDCRSRSEWVVRSWQLKLLCHDCQQAIVEPEQEIYLDGDGKDTVFCRVWPAEQRDRQAWYCQGGEWLQVPAQTKPLATAVPPDEAIEAAFDIPPHLDFSHHNRHRLAVMRDCWDQDNEIPVAAPPA